MNNDNYPSILLRTSVLRSTATALLLAVSGSVVAADMECGPEPYPTAVVADYVLGCMSANGNDYESLHKCSCSIDFIQSRVSYADYEKAQTVMQVKLDRGQRGLFYRESSWAKDTLETLEKVQAESTLRCF